MEGVSEKNIQLFNQNLRYEQPSEIIDFVLQFAKNPWLTTSFGPYSAALLYAVTLEKPDIQVVWCDTGFNTNATYNHARSLIEKLQLNIEICTPKYTTAYIKNKVGEPTIDNPNHGFFSEKVKLEPFREALQKHRPDVWFTNLRKGQTTHRDSLDILSFTNEGILKVCPFYHFTDADLEQFLKAHDLPVEFDYYDPVKALENRECGIHLQE
ncbi:phosphoadenosine phosphosulfate reductase domain-containing protein [Marixanthomonas spongiae]|uniref:Phosphoadenylylsulfate reductase n=1 Tax=Marixanthomonas spongiae TaxID=2174845 RepID=A0A2U0I7N2_9FLAO|nr:phosphoadenosine phosphosulfate reductase family protein [Marixanthomonas spongiae]PVW17109.1 phosphoadenylylsulfate reductase [Marixanthomonas spongiae]